MGALSVAVWQGGATSAMNFSCSNQEKTRASFCPSKLALHVQYEYKKVRYELLTIKFEIQNSLFNI